MARRFRGDLVAQLLVVVTCAVVLGIIALVARLV
jgi:hypothetical protein